ncbi:14896_t:CDS:1 [Cetraspora pellucida]|uniref:14896_t:CDS:1 n=2 Tax=Gigasporaceae TaxID=36753 RepID=A0A9N8ZW24_9GLOM|nr:14896_t:CDS:1 [Cetraspora pellucida]
MDVEARNKYCGLLMFTPSIGASGTKNSNNIVNYDATSFSFSESEPSYNDSSSIAAGAAATDENESGKKSPPGCSKAQLEKRPPRPPNAFILYRREKQPAILAAHRHLTNAQISRYIADLWRGESNETRLHWEREADKTKLEHMKAYPNYVYRPNKKGKNDKKRRERRKSSNPLLSTNSVEPGPFKVKINKGQNRMNPLSGQDTTKVSDSYQSLTSTSPIQQALESSYWMTSNNGTNDDIQLPVTPQQQFQGFADLWAMIPSQPVVLSPNNPNLSHLSFQNINELPPTFREEIIDPSSIMLLNDNPFLDQTVFINTKSSNNNNPNTGVGNNQYDNIIHNPIDEIFARMEYFKNELH